MNRRDYLTIVAGASVGTTGAAGCLSNGGGSGTPTTTTTESDGPNLTPSPNTTLGPPADPRAAPEKLPWPGYGQRIPDVTLPAALQDREVQTLSFDTPLALTFIYTNCQTQCPFLTQALKRAQDNATADGYGDAVNFVELTFDPERDTQEALAAYAEERDVNLDAGNWYFLRPPTVERAETVIQDQFGLNFARTEPEDMDQYMFTHRSLILLVNSDGYVERTYGGGAETITNLSDDMRELHQA